MTLGEFIKKLVDTNLPLETPVILAHVSADVSDDETYVEQGVDSVEPFTFNEGDAVLIRFCEDAG